VCSGNWKKNGKKKEIEKKNDFGQKNISSQVSGQKWAKSEKKTDLLNF
jgi:hypothetical protein